MLPSVNKDFTYLLTKPNKTNSWSKGVTTPMKAPDECCTSGIHVVHAFAIVVFNLDRETWQWQDIHFVLSHNERAHTNLPNYYLPTYLPTYLTIYLHTYQPTTYLPTYLPSDQPAYLPYLPTYPTTCTRARAQKQTNTHTETNYARTNAHSHRHSWPVVPWSAVLRIVLSFEVFLSERLGTAR